MKSKWILLLLLSATLLLDACVLVPVQPGYPGYVAGPPVVVAPAYIRGYGYYGYGYYGYGRRHW